MDTPKKASLLRRAYLAARELEWNWSLLGYLGLTGKVTAMVSGLLTGLVATVQGVGAAGAIALGMFVAACATVIIAGARAPKTDPSEWEWADKDGYEQMPVPKRTSAPIPSPDDDPILLRKQIEKNERQLENRRLRIAELETIAEGYRLQADGHDATVKQMARDQVSLEERNEALEAEVSRLGAIISPPPPESDLTPHERAVALNELDKLLKKADRVRDDAWALLDLVTYAVKESCGLIGRDLNNFLVPHLTPAKEALDSLRAAIKDATSAEVAQDHFLNFLLKYNEARWWMARLAQHAGVDLTDGFGAYPEWYRLDQDFWARVEEIGDNGPLRRLVKSLGRSQLMHERVPCHIPEPTP